MQTGQKLQTTISPKNLREDAHTATYVLTIFNILNYFSDYILFTVLKAFYGFQTTPT